MRRPVIALLLVLATACAGEESTSDGAPAAVTPAVGDPAGERVFVGTWYDSTSSPSTGQIVFSLKPASGTTPGAAEATLVVPGLGPAVVMSGTVTSAGRVSVSFSPGQGVVIAFTGAIAATPSSSGVASTLAGVITDTGDPIGVASAEDATVDAVTPFCGTYGGDLSGDWLFQASSNHVSGTYTDGALHGARSGNALTIAFVDAVAADHGTATGDVTGAGAARGVGNGRWSTSDRAYSGTWAGTVCADSVATCCSGTGAATRCKVGASSTQPPTCP